MIGNGTASTLVSSCGLASAGANRSSINSRIKRPPLPCARLRWLREIPLRGHLNQCVACEAVASIELTVADSRVIDGQSLRNQDFETPPR